jgi:hypothetical protein
MRALLVHAIAGRARLRIEGRESDAALSSSLCTALCAARPAKRR